MNSPFRNIPRAGDDVRNLRGWLEDLGRGSGGQEQAESGHQGLSHDGILQRRNWTAISAPINTG